MTGMEALTSALTSVSIDPARIKTLTDSEKFRVVPPHIKQSPLGGLAEAMLKANLAQEATNKLIGRLVEQGLLTCDFKTVDGNMVATVSLTVLKPEA